MMFSEKEVSSNSADRQPRLTGTGGKLGIGASFLASVLFLLIWPLLATIVTGEGLSNYLLTDGLALLIFTLIVYWTLGLLIVFLISVVPGVIAGVGNAKILETIARKKMLTIVRGIVVGILVGCIAGVMVSYPGTVLMMNLVVDVYPPYEKEAFIQLFISGVIAGAIAGAWHGWKMSRMLHSNIH